MKDPGKVPVKVWVVGGDGNLGTCVREKLESVGVDCVCTDLGDVDIREAARVDRFADDCQCSHVINCAAYTAVDAAESDAENAARVNDVAVGHLAAAAARIGATIAHVSTDYVFDGTASEPYAEDAPTSPLGVYGATKLAGERRLVAAVSSRVPYFIVRTSWLFGPRGRDFVGKMAGLVRERDEVRVVSDQRGRPTYAPDLAGALLRVCGIVGGGGGGGGGGGEPAAPSGVYHFANAGETTWYDLTVAIARAVGSDCRIVPIATAEYPTPATRPAYSVLSTDKLTAATGIVPRHWTAALADCIEGAAGRT